MCVDNISNNRKKVVNFYNLKSFQNYEKRYTRGDLTNNEN